MSYQSIADEEKQSLLGGSSDHGHSHSHGGHEEESHGHSHSHGGHEEESHGHSHSHGDDKEEAHGHSHSHGGGGHSHGEIDSAKREAGKAAQRKLLRACILCFFFMVAEVVGGFMANSLAIMTDAAHLLSDVASFVLGITAIHLASLPSTKIQSYGYVRAEILGAIISVLGIWVLAGILLYEATFRFIAALGPHPPLHTDGKIMFIVATIGLVVNLSLMKILGHSHSHGLGGGHGHSHGGGHEHSHGAPAGYGAVDSDEKAEEDEEEEILRKEVENINVQAAYIHALGDVVQSVGVIIAGGLIWWRPEYQIADPIATFLFSLLVLYTTVDIMKHSVRALMEFAPEGCDPEKIHNGLLALDTVTGVHDLHIWSITVGSTALSVHIDSTSENAEETLHSAQKFLRANNIHHSTIQVEHTDGKLNLDCAPCV